MFHAELYVRGTPSQMIERTLRNTLRYYEPLSVGCLVCLIDSVYGYYGN